jgi:Na+-driven multidrug efflux pump
MEKDTLNQNPLKTAPIGRLLLKFAVPSISSSLAIAAYNITNQILIGQRIGYLGNAATGIAFPIMTLNGALAYLFGIGCASNFSLNLGADNKDAAAKVVGTSIFYYVFRRSYSWNSDLYFCQAAYDSLRRNRANTT